MRNLKLNYKTFNIALILATFFTFSCSKDEGAMNGNGHLNLNVSSNTTNILRTTNSTRSKNGNATVAITDFIVNIKEFELEIDVEEQDDENETWDDDGFYDFNDEINFVGPFEMDLMSNNLSIFSVEIPNAVYEELKFKFEKSTDPNSSLLDKSILIKGTIDNIPFEFWHDFEDEVEVDFENPEFDIAIQNNGIELSINFDLSNVLNSLTGVDLSQAVDGNTNGIIEINPNDLDGNNTIAEQIKNKIKDYIDLSDD